MNIQKIATTIAITAGLGFMSLTPAQADESESRYSNYGDQRHQVQNNRRDNRALRHQIRDNRRENKVIRHQAREQRRYTSQREHRRDKQRIRQYDNYQNRYVNRPLEHRYKHKNGIPHRHAAGVAVPHKSWRKQHQRWNYASYGAKGHQSSLQVRFSSATKPHGNRYIY